MTNIVDNARSILHALIPDPADRSFLRTQLHRIAVRLVDQDQTAPPEVTAVAHRTAAMAHRLRILLGDRPASLPAPQVPEVLLSPAGSTVLLPDPGCSVRVDLAADDGTVVINVAGVPSSRVEVYVGTQAVYVPTPTSRPS